MGDKNPMTPAGTGFQCPHGTGKSPTCREQPRGSRTTAEIRRWLKPWQRPSSFLQEPAATGRASDSIITQSGLSFLFPLAALGKTDSPFGSLQPQPLSQSSCLSFTVRAAERASELFFLLSWDGQCCSGDSPHLGEALSTQKVPAQPQWTAKDFAREEESK